MSYKANARAIGTLIVAYNKLTIAANEAAAAARNAIDWIAKQNRLMESVLAGPAGESLRQYIEIVHLQATGKFNGRDAYDLADTARKLEQQIRRSGGKDASSLDFGAIRKGAASSSAESRRTAHLRGLI